MKEVTRHNFTDKYAFQAEKRVNGIMADENLSHGQRMVALMLEAQDMCKHQIPLPPARQTPDLFSELPTQDPYALCVASFQQVLQETEKTKLAERFHPANMIKSSIGDTSVLTCAYQLQLQDGKKYPELKRFYKLIKGNFPQEVKENAEYEKRMAQEDKYQRSLSKDYKSGKLKTKAYDIFTQKLSPNYKYMLLMHNAACALKEAPHTDLQDPYYNPELMVSLSLTSKSKGNPDRNNMLYHIRSNIVEPKIKARHPGNPHRQCTPFEYAEELSKTEGLEDLGKLFQNRLVEHQDTLDLFARAPQVFEKGYRKKHKPS